MNVKFLILMLLSSIFVPSKVNNEPTAISLDKYLGKWYEIARFRSEEHTSETPVT